MGRIHEAMRRAEEEKSSSDRHALGEFQGLRFPTASERTMDSGQGFDDSPSTEETVSRDLPVQPVSKGAFTQSAVFLDLGQKLSERGAGRDFRSLLITSPGAREGKSTVAVNLAIVGAQELTKSVLLIDGNLRNPTVHRLLGMRNDRGLAEILTSEVRINEAVKRTDVPRFHVVTAGRTASSPTELLNTQRMKTFLTSVDKQFDWVVLDSPDLLSCADAELMATLSGQVLLVLSPRAHRTKTMQAVEMLRGKTVVGIVLNTTNGSNSFAGWLPKPGLFSPSRIVMTN